MWSWCAKSCRQVSASPARLLTSALHLTIGPTILARRCADRSATMPGRCWSVAARAARGGSVAHLQPPSVAEDTFVREWALFAVRNMCEVSADAQQVIRCVVMVTPEFFVLRELARRELDAQSAPTLDGMD